MMELNFNTLGKYLHYLNQEPQIMVFVAAFGVPLFMFIFAITVSRIYKGMAIAKSLNTIIFTTLGITWIPGFVISIILLLMEVSGIKLLFVWLSLLVVSFIFSVSNTSAIMKLFQDMMESPRFKDRT